MPVGHQQQRRIREQVKYPSLGRTPVDPSKSQAKPPPAKAPLESDSEEIHEWRREYRH